MASNLIYLHIPKTAGTAFRELLNDNYSAAETYWHGLSKDRDREISTYKIIGGHEPYSFYKKFDSRKLFVVAVRDPISRAVSLYNFHRRTENRPSYCTWVENGLDPDSMLNTIQNSELFRSEISNSQCHYISDGKTFEDVMDVLSKDEFIIGSHEHFDQLAKFLATSLGWREHNLSRSNVGKPGYATELLSDTKLVDLIKEINQEDIRLYERIKSRKLLLSYNANLPLNDFAPECIPEFPSYSVRSKIVLKAVQQHKTITLRKNESIEVRFMIHNQSDSTIPCAGDYPVKIAYHWYFENNSICIWDGLRTQLYDNIPAQQIASVTAVIQAPAKAGQFTLAVGLVIDNIAWFESSNPNHLEIIHANVAE